jgi:hypothetical protein
MVPADRPALPALVVAMSERIAAARRRSLSAVSREMVLLYWELGRHIVEFEQGGQDRAEYGEALLSTLAGALTRAHGRGFSERNLLNFRAFYRAFPDSADASAELTWSHFVRLLRVENELARRFYVKHACTGRLVRPRAGSAERRCSPPESAPHREDGHPLRLDHIIESVVGALKHQPPHIRAAPVLVRHPGAGRAPEQAQGIDQVGGTGPALLPPRVRGLDLGESLWSELNRDAHPSASSRRSTSSAGIASPRAALSAAWSMASSSTRWHSSSRSSPSSTR